MNGESLVCILLLQSKINDSMIVGCTILLHSGAASSCIEGAGLSLWTHLHFSPKAKESRWEAVWAGQSY